MGKPTEYALNAGYPRLDGTRYKITGLPLTDRMKRYGITGIVFFGDICEITTEAGTETAPTPVGLWLASKP